MLLYTINGRHGAIGSAAISELKCGKSYVADRNAWCVEASAVIITKLIYNRNVSGNET